MDNPTAGFHRTRSHTAFYIESDLRSNSTPDLKIGFRIVYRLIFRRTRGSTVNSVVLAHQGRESVIKVFGLDENHFSFPEPVFSRPHEMNSVFWEVYWDKGYLDLRKIRQFERKLHSIAKLNQIAIEQVGTTVMARELAYLHSSDMHHVE